jgi:magnesium transporter
MIRVLYYDTKMKHTEFGDRELIDRWSNNDDAFVWIDFTDEDPDLERALMTERFGIQSLAIDDAQRKRHPPKLEWFDRYFFLLMKGFTAETDNINFGVVHISFFVGANFMVTRHWETSPSIDIVWRRLKKNELSAENGPAYLCYRVVRTIIDRYTPIILNLEQRLDHLEEEMLADPSDALLGELVTYNSKLKKLRRIFGYQQTILSQLRASEHRFVAHIKHEFQDAHEQMERMASLSSMLQELTRDLMDGYISVTSHRLNNIMKLLTIASVIFLPLTFIAGIYGMNFEFMPELTAKHGYFLALGAMVTVAVVLLTIFRKMRWI